jgi:hypothetical protein
MVSLGLPVGLGTGRSKHVGAETRETGIDALDGLVPRRQDLRCRRAVTNDLCGRKSAGETRQPPSHVLRVWLAQARHTPCSPSSGIARQRWLSGILPTRGPLGILFPDIRGAFPTLTCSPARQPEPFYCRHRMPVRLRLTR